ncbi:MULTISPECIES: coiled-coil domain-containing protein [Streptosporangium]|uniref:ARB-07466-like C-terminal domain-containing protein n=1 Tax=Streptosporangium brasiliense TaxID=47480 RepID=A0ABT9RF06_9ACTN|nr:hypothetical protein [Streptosporangium brasiliense]MDP9867840.1 hypothetical protein [Streptosporangium brasiliense]
MGSGNAAPRPDAEQLRRQPAGLQKEYDAFIAGYNANRIALGDARNAEKLAATRLGQAQRDYEAARTRVAEMVRLRYQATPFGTGTPLLAAGDPHASIHAAALLQQKADGQTENLRRFEEVRDTRRLARESAARRARELREKAEEVGREKRTAERLIAKIEDALEQIVPTPGLRRPDGTWVPEIPGGPDNITPRLRLLRTQAESRFDIPSGIGCYRTRQDGGEHPQGRACDFMITRGGTWPSPAQVALGDRLAAWAIGNARRLGVKYVIYRQRIWQGGGWRAMSDRGSITENHQDHVHISMF